MRFGISRSPSPLHTRKKIPSRSSVYGLGAYDSSDEEENDQIISDDASSSSSASPSYPSRLAAQAPLRPLNENMMRRSAQEQREIRETVLSFRRHGEYEDPFKTWAKETHTAAFRTASKRYENNPASLAAAQKRAAEIHERSIKALNDREYQKMEKIFQSMALEPQHQAELLAKHKERERLLWQRVEGVIKDEEDKVRRRLEAEEKARREEEEKRRREEEHRKKEEEKRKKEEQEKALKEELLRKKKTQEEAETKKRAEEEKQKRVEMDRMEKGRKEAGFSTPQEDWETGRQSLKILKQGYLLTVKRDPTVRSIWSKGRRAMVPKIGQLTNSQSEIQRITTAILQVFHVQPPHPEPLYFSLLSALAKAILMQAETEVSARAVTAIPLAQVTIGLLTQLEFFSDILFARMVQRTGGWAVPIPVPKPAEMSEIEYKKLRGYRTEREEQKDFENRIRGIVTLYFAVLTADVSQPMPPMWALPRYWTYLARLMRSPILLRSDMAMQIMAAALDVGGARGKRAWGVQFVKLLGLIYKSVQETSASESQDTNEKQIGASGMEGRPARVRVILEIEKVMSS